MQSNLKKMINPNIFRIKPQYFTTKDSMLESSIRKKRASFAAI